MNEVLGRSAAIALVAGVWLEGLVEPFLLSVQGVGQDQGHELEVVEKVTRAVQQGVGVLGI